MPLMAELTARPMARFMAQDQIRFASSVSAGNDAGADEALRREPPARAPAVEADAPNAADRDQLEREIAAIERACAALRRGEPELQFWTDPPPRTLQKPRSVWLLIGVLWLSTALATIVAAFAISALVG
jgi:hypothetical protein